MPHRRFGVATGVGVRLSTETGWRLSVAGRENRQVGGCGVADSLIIGQNSNNELGQQVVFLEKSLITKTWTATQHFVFVENVSRAEMMGGFLVHFHVQTGAK